MCVSAVVFACVCEKETVCVVTVDKTKLNVSLSNPRHPQCLRKVML